MLVPHDLHLRPHTLSTSDRCDPHENARCTPPPCDPTNALAAQVSSRVASMCAVTHLALANTSAIHGPCHQNAGKAPHASQMCAINSTLSKSLAMAAPPVT